MSEEVFQGQLLHSGSSIVAVLDSCHQAVSWGAPTLLPWPSSGWELPGWELPVWPPDKPKETMVSPCASSVLPAPLLSW